MKARVPRRGPCCFDTYQKMKIAIQGESGCFHEVAARQYFNYDEIEIVPCSTFDLELTTLKGGGAEFAVMAIENARSGSILYNYTLIRESGMKILGEHNLRIKQNLMALPGQKITDIREIRSHPIALAQCMTFLNQFPGITLIESDDTAGSAKQINQTKAKGVAAIASSGAAEIYLHLVQRRYMVWKYSPRELKLINKTIRGFWLSEMRRKETREATRFQSVSPPDINPGHWQKFS